MKQLLHGARKLSPYLLVEVLLPGGTLLALLLWLYRHFYNGQSTHSEVRLPEKHSSDNCALGMPPAFAQEPASEGIPSLMKPVLASLARTLSWLISNVIPALRSDTENKQAPVTLKEVQHS